MSLSISTPPAVPPTSLQVVIRAAQAPDPTLEPAPDPAPDDTAPSAPNAPGQTLDVTA